jgi:hypothetical protein
MTRVASFNRRGFLHGTSIGLAIPTLDSVGAETCAADTTDGKPKPRRLVCVGNHLGFYPGNFFPADAGKDYKSTSTLQPLQQHRDDLTVFSNLDHQLNGGHKAVHGFLSGIKKEEAAGFPVKNISLDQAAAEHVGSETRFASINAGLGEGTDMCWTRSGVRIPPVNNPATLFKALFVESNQAELKAERTRLMHRASVLDALSDSAQALNRTLNVADRNKLDQYLTSVRDVEKRLQMSKEWIDRPKPIAPIDNVAEEERMQIDEMKLLYDLLALALQTDSTRVATLEIPLGFQTVELNLGGYHGLSHHSKSEERLSQLQVVEAFFTERLSDFMSRLKEAQIFDETLIVFGSGMSDGSIHSNRDLPVLLAGGGIRHRGHVACPAAQHERVPLSNLWLSVLQWFGSEQLRFGKSTGVFSPMKIS